MTTSKDSAFQENLLNAISARSSRVIQPVDEPRVREIVTEMLKPLADDNFALAAGQCIVKDGLINDEGGTQHCEMRRQRNEWRKLALEARAFLNHIDADELGERIDRMADKY